MNISKKMRNAILRIVRPFTNNLEECDGRDLNGVAISLNYGNERQKEFNPLFWDFCEVVIQDVRFDGVRKRDERNVYIVNHNGESFKY